VVIGEVLGRDQGKGIEMGERDGMGTERERERARAELFSGRVPSQRYGEGSGWWCLGVLCVLWELWVGVGVCRTWRCDLAAGGGAVVHGGWSASGLTY